MDNFSKRLVTSDSAKLSTITPKHSNMVSANYHNIISSSGHGTKTLPLKTPNKTPLRLSSKKKTPNTLTNDRYIPNRTSSNMEASFHLLVSQKDKENIKTSSGNSSNSNSMDNIKRKLINETCHGVVSDKAKVLSLRGKVPSSEQAFTDNLKIYRVSGNSASTKKSSQRTIQTAPDKILDAPDFLDDFYLNLIDWSSTNNLAVALNKDLYIWNSTTKDIYNLFSMEENSRDYISSVAWIEKGNVLAVGNSKNIVELWDINKKVCLRQMKSHSGRIGSLAWNRHMLSSGSRTGDIHSHDVRVAQHHTSTFKLHTQEVCGLKWSPDYRYLASGGNDNVVGIWDVNNVSSTSEAMFTFREHSAAVKAIAWCPWQNNVIATGGGTSDKQIKIWNSNNGTVHQSVDANSQVSSILWSSAYREIISSHGYQQNQLSIWKYPEMNKVCDLLGHANRILGMAMSPDAESVVSIGADETLRFWQCFQADENLKKSKEAANRAAKNTAAHKIGLGRGIR